MPFGELSEPTKKLCVAFEITFLQTAHYKSKYFKQLEIKCWF